MKETLRCEWVNCNKSDCRGCPHGPYWYAYWRERGKLKKRYIGKGRPHHDAPPKPGEKAPQPDYRDSIFSDRTAYDGLAFDILEMGITHDMAEITRCYRKKASLVHPDKGGSDHECRLCNAAYHYLRAKYHK